MSKREFDFTLLVQDPTPEQIRGVSRNLGMCSNMGSALSDPRMYDWIAANRREIILALPSGWSELPCTESSKTTAT